MEARPRLLVVVIALCLISSIVGVAENVMSYRGGAATYNAKSYGAKGDGANDNTKVCTRVFQFGSCWWAHSSYVDAMSPWWLVQALMAAWKVACAAAGTVTLMIPPGTYYIGPTQFHGPCKASALTFLLQARSCGHQIN
jgi:hypothetical protein